ncbi:hypothetical protein E8E13_002879 [Curvularia kusanoi]|uniref:Uncharacterized protein n=1 Tax=Curvularia kusanoi TaxID=90978 RepID=A0A9P4W9H9_CURKU|nr:hypothetical protein E8E13_002879 [Curvularia kusanoi]
MPEPFRLSGIAEEEPANDLPAGDDNPSPNETASLADALASLDLDISTFSTRQLINAALQEAKRANDDHLDTIDTTLDLLRVLDGLSKTIKVLREEMLEKKRSCEDRARMLHAVERAVEKLLFTDEEREGSIEDESADFEDEAGTERSITPTASRW